MQLRLIILAIGLLWSAPSISAMTATYGNPQFPVTMKLEVADNGDMRMEMRFGKLPEGSPPMPAGFSMPYTIMRGGHGYFITREPAGPTVTRAEDAAAVTAEAISKSMPDFSTSMKDVPYPILVAKGTQTINGRIGTAYYFQRALERDPRHPHAVIVVSSDPALAPLAEAWKRSVGISNSMMIQTMGSMPQGNQLLTIFSSGAPILFAGLELQSVDTSPVPESEFELPAAPLSLEQVRERMTQGLSSRPPSTAPAPAPSH